MGTIKSNQKNKKRPSTFALLIDDISKMSEPEQKVLWRRINMEKLSSFAKELDVSVVSHNLSSDEIDVLINEAKKNGKKKKD